MKDNLNEFRPNLAGMDFNEWIVELDTFVEDCGSFESLGAEYSAAHVDAGSSLLVTFENFEEIKSQGRSAEPIGFDFVRRLGWSHLSILSEKPAFGRSERVYRYFDRLIDDGFFEDFQRVLFFGAHEGGYAASAFSVAAPGARVLALRPVATLDPRISGWDTRHKSHRRLNFNDRYGYAPDMLEAADRAYVLADQYRPLDAMQAALFARDNVTQIRTPRLGQRMPAALREMSILAPLIESAMAGTLSEQSFATLFRCRRDYVPYLRQLIADLQRAGRYDFALKVCEDALSRDLGAHFEKLREQTIERQANA